MNDQEIELEDINFSKQIVVENNIEQKINNDLFSLGDYNTKATEFEQKKNDDNDNLLVSKELFDAMMSELHPFWGYSVFDLFTHIRNWFKRPFTTSDEKKGEDEKP